jgi:hypothetical protein
MDALTPAYLAEDVSGGLFPTVIAMTTLAVIAVILRFVARYYAKTNLWWDDWSILIALVCPSPL